MGPNRCLVARTVRSAWWRSPSTPRTVSTRCSKVRGPGQGPVLGDVAHQHEGHPMELGQVHDQVGARPHLAEAARGARRRRGRRRPGSSRRPPAPGPCRASGPGSGGQVGGGEEHEPGGQGPQALGPAPHLLGRLLGRDEQHRAPRVGHGRQDLEQQGGLPHARARRRAGSPSPARARPRGPGRARARPVGTGPDWVGSTASRGRAGRSLPRAGPRLPGQVQSSPGRARGAAAGSTTAPRPGCSTRHTPGTARPSAACRSARATPVHRSRPSHAPTLGRGVTVGA